MKIESIYTELLYAKDQRVFYKFELDEIYWEYMRKRIGETLSHAAKTMVWDGLTPVSSQIADNVRNVISANVCNH